MTIKSVTKKILLTVLIVFIIFNLATCAVFYHFLNKDTPPGVQTASLPTREDVFKNLVQSTVNKYGILNQEEITVDSEIKANGLWEAKAFDITGDVKDELFLVYVDNNTIKMEIYEYKKGNAVKKWNQDAAWGSIYHLSVHEVSDTGKVYWEYGETRGYTADLYSYEDGLYKSAYSMHEGWTDEEWEKYGGEYTNRWEEGDIYRTILKSRFNIFTSYEEENEIISLASDLGIGSANKDELVERWALKIPEPKVSPAEALGNIVYYGDKNICKMPKEMALAYADAIESEHELAMNCGETAKVCAVLMDVANDGMPLLLTSIVTLDFNFDKLGYIDNEMAFYIWTWDGSKAQKYDIIDDTLCKYTFGYDFWPNSSNEKLIVHDGLAMDIGGVSGSISYNVSNAQLTKINHRMTYRAYQENIDSNKVYTEIYPNIKTWKDEYDREYTTIEEVVNAGWTCINPDRDEDEIAYYIAEYVNGKLVKHHNYNEFLEMDNPYYEHYEKGYHVIAPSTGPWELTSEWSELDDAKKALELYSKVAGRPQYSYEDVTIMLSDSQIKAIAKEAAKKVKGEIGEIYKLNENLYLVVIYVDGSVSGTVIVKNTKNGTAWRVVAADTKAMTAEAVSKEINKDSQTINIKLDTSKISEGSEYLKKVLGDIDGTTPNSAAKDEIIKYIETSVSQTGKVSIKAKKNVVSLDKKDVEKAIENAQNSNEEYKELLDEYGVTLDKPVVVIVYVIVENIDSGKAMQVTFDEEIADMLSDDNELMLVLGDTKCTVKVSKESLDDILGEYGSLTVTVKKTADGEYTIQFADSEGKMIEALNSALTFTLPANDTLATVWAEYTGGAGNWGGQLDSANGTISFDTPYSGTYTVMSENVDITDIQNLSDEHQKAIMYMVSKGYFTLDNGRFNPDMPLRRYDFAEAIVGMFFANDPSAVATFADISKDDPYYQIVASGEKLNIIKGYEEDNTFQGNRNMSREEALALCSRTLVDKKKYTRPDNPYDYLHFTDNGDITDWARGEIALTVRESLIEDGGMLYPLSEINRADAALLLYKLFMLTHEVEPVSVITNASPLSSGSLLWIILAAIILLLIILILLVVLLVRRKKQDNQEAVNKVIEENIE